MNTNDISDKQYELLYKRYLDKDPSPKKLLDMAGMKEGDRVLDLCSGANARVAKAAIETGALYVACVDLNPLVQQMNNKDWEKKIPQAKIEAFCSDVYGYMEYTDISLQNKFNIVVCQQGINYWLTAEAAVKTYGVMRGGSKFVFDASNKKPSDKPVVKEYKIDDKAYVEATWLIGDMVNHIQIVETSASHFTEFKWIPPEKIKWMCESASFKVEVITNGNTDIYVCTKVSRAKVK